MSTLHPTPPKQPLVLILGATGTGKSNLAIQLAQCLQSSPITNSWTSAEIINADAMQLYRGLPIITNKVSPAEQQGIPHHLLDHISLDEEPWTVHKYIVEAERVIQEIRERGKLPIVVGGTSYYVLGLLFKSVLLGGNTGSRAQEKDGDDADHGKNAEQTWPILAASTHEIYSQLQEVDPEMAASWHPNDRRKIQRSLEIYLRTGRKASQVYREQKTKFDGSEESERGKDQSDSGSGLKCDPIIFWLEAEDKVLKGRLDQRVDNMVHNGLLDEATAMDDAKHQLENRGLSIDESKGIWASIGYKEMAPWIEAVREQKDDQRAIEKLKVDCIESVKTGTRQYAKRQNRFIRIRLANLLKQENKLNHLFLLDCTNLEKWTENSLNPALNILDFFLQGKKLPEPASFSAFASEIFAGMVEDNSSTKRVTKRCDVCNKIMVGKKQWSAHVNSQGHKRVLQAIRKREINATRRQAAIDEKETKPA